MSTKSIKSKKNKKSNIILNTFKRGRGLQLLLAVVVVAVIAVIGEQYFSQSHAAAISHPANVLPTKYPLPVSYLTTRVGNWWCQNDRVCWKNYDVTNTGPIPEVYYCSFPTTVERFIHEGIYTTEQVNMQSSPGAQAQAQGYIYYAGTLQPGQDVGYGSVELWYPNNLPTTYNATNIEVYCQIYTGN